MLDHCPGEGIEPRLGNREGNRVVHNALPICNHTPAFSFVIKFRQPLRLFRREPGDKGYVDESGPGFSRAQREFRVNSRLFVLPTRQACCFHPGPLGPAHSRPQELAVASAKLIVLVVNLSVGRSREPEVCDSGRACWVVRRKLQHQHCGYIFAAQRIVGVKRSGKQRGKTFLRIFDPVSRPLRRGKGKVVIKNRKCGILPTRMVIGRSACTDLPGEAVALPFQPF